MLAQLSVHLIRVLPKRARSKNAVTISTHIPSKNLIQNLPLSIRHMLLAIGLQNIPTAVRRRTRSMITQTSTRTGLTINPPIRLSTLLNIQARQLFLPIRKKRSKQRGSLTPNRYLRRRTRNCYRAKARVQTKFDTGPTIKTRCHNPLP